MKKWVSRIEQGQFPIFRHSHQALKSIQADNNQGISQYRAVVLNDPGLTIGLLRDVNLRQSNQRESVETIGHTALLLGMNQIPKLGLRLPLVEKQNDAIAAGYRKAASKAYHAACQANDWNHYLGKHDSEEIFVAAQLRAVAEMGLWACGGCMQMQKISDLMKQHGVPQIEAEQKVLGFQVDQLGLKLAQKWQFSEVLQDSLNGREDLFPRSKALKLASDFVNAVEFGWNHPQAEAVMLEIADFLNMDGEITSDRVKSCAMSAAQKSNFFGVEHAAYRLMRPATEQESASDAATIPLLVETEPDVKPPEAAPEPEAIADPTPAPEPAPEPEPQPIPEPAPEPTPTPESVSEAITIRPVVIGDDGFLRASLGQLKEAEHGGIGVHKLIDLVLEGASRGLGLDRVFFAMLNQDKSALVVRFLKGTEDDPLLKYSMSLGQRDLFALLMSKPQSVFLQARNRAKYWHLVPEAFASLIETDVFFASSIFAKGKPIGMFYGDRHNADKALSDEDYRYFKRLCAHTSKAIQTTAT